MLLCGAPTLLGQRLIRFELLKVNLSRNLLPILESMRSSIISASGEIETDAWIGCQPCCKCLFIEGHLAIKTCIIHYISTIQRGFRALCMLRNEMGERTISMSQRV